MDKNGCGVSCVGVLSFMCMCVCVCSYFAEAMTQMHARHLADLFNKEVKRKRLQIAPIV